MIKWILAVVLISPLASGMSYTAQIYRKGSERKDLLFKFEHTDRQENGVEKGRNVYRSLDGKEAVIETIEIKDGHLQRYELDHRQTGNIGLLEVNGVTSQVTYTKKDGTKKTRSRKWHENSVVGPTMIPFIRAHFDQIKEGKTIEADFFVLDRQDSFTFRYSKVREEIVAGAKQIVVVMKPASAFVRMLVDPLFIYFTEDGSKVVRIEGRTVPKLEEDGKFKDLDAESVYSY